MTVFGNRIFKKTSTLEYGGSYSNMTSILLRRPGHGSRQQGHMKTPDTGGCLQAEERDLRRQKGRDQCLDLKLLASRTMRHGILLLKPHHLWHFVMEALANKYICILLWFSIQSETQQKLTILTTH